MAKKFKDTFSSNGRVESLYLTLINNLLKPIKKEVLKAAKSGDVNKVAKLLVRASKSRLFNRKSKEIAKKIVSLEWEIQEKDWRTAARKASKNPEFYELLQLNLKGDIKTHYDEIIEQNAKIIKTLPLNISRDVVKHISRKQFEGERPESLSKEIQDFFSEHSKAKEKLIARTESSKCKEALMQVRSESVGVRWAQWVSTDDRRTRPAHAFMDGVIFDYKHPPAAEELAKKAGKYKGKTYGHYGPGNIFNCRCYSAPVISLKYLKYPIQVYDWKKDAIVKMNKQQFIDFTKLHKSYCDLWDEF